MLALRYAYLLALVVWLGGLLTLGGLGAPAIFASLTAAHGMAGREMAGLAFGSVLRRFHLAAYGCAVVMIVTFSAMAVLGPRPVRFAVRLGIIVGMLAITLYSGLVVSRRVERLQREIGGPVAALPDADPRRTAFGRLHGLSTTLLLVSAVGGLSLLFWEARRND
jgi:hypothetical protein